MHSIRFDQKWRRGSMCSSPAWFFFCESGLGFLTWLEQSRECRFWYEYMLLYKPKLRCLRLKLSMFILSERYIIRYFHAACTTLPKTHHLERHTHFHKFESSSVSSLSSEPCHPNRPAPLGPPGSYCSSSLTYRHSMHRFHP